MAALVCFATTAYAVEAPAAAQKILDSAPLKPEDAVGWDLQDILQGVAAILTENIKEPLQFAIKATLYLLVASAIGIAASEGWRACVDGVAVLGFGTLSMRAMMALTASVGKTALDCQTYLIAFVPVYSSVVTLGGQPTGGLLYSGMFLTMSAFLSTAIQQVLLPVMQIYFCLAACAALWGAPGTEQAAALFARCLSWLLKGCGALFGFVLGLQNLLAGNMDSAALKCGQGILEGAIPVIGDAASAALGSALAAVRLLKGSLALAAVLALGATFAPVFIHCALYALAFMVAGIVASASGSKQCSQLCRLYAEGARLCGAVLVLYFFMVFLSTALLLISGNAG